MKPGTKLFTKNSCACGNAAVARVHEGDVPEYDVLLESGEMLNRLSVNQVTRMFFVTTYAADNRIFKKQIRKLAAKTSVTGILPVYSVKAVSTGLGLERRLLVAASSLKTVAKTVANHPDFRGWIVSAPDTAKLPLRGIVMGTRKHGVITVL